MTIDLPTPHPMPSHPRRRDGKAPLPAPQERVRLRRAWMLTEEQVARSFGVTAATVRSWETGRTSPTGRRRAAYAAFLGGLAHGLVPAPADGGSPPSGAPRSPRTRRRACAVPAPAARPLPVTGRPERPASGETPVLPGRAPAPAGLPVGPGPDPVAPGRLRRFRLMSAAVGVWIAVEHLVATVPPPHV
ncbi:helix-turn-helix domain-containing protein [Streptomyces sp. NPDC101225]|uniref:helix-turn-helix domain-containing protein n=1 Tax=Streptomyces sp. NPDC101225 TaxID=3366135 RepID=UPI003826625D